jgi:hypothetical protein
MQLKLLVDTTYAIHTNYKYIELILKPYHMSSSKQKFRNTIKWDDKNDIRTQ